MIRPSYIMLVFCSLIVGIKLFVVMGAPLVTEGIMWNIQNYIPFYFWYVTNIMVSSQGIIITSVLLFKRKAFQQLQTQVNLFIYKRLNFFEFPSIPP